MQDQKTISQAPFMTRRLTGRSNGFLHQEPGKPASRGSAREDRVGIEALNGPTCSPDLSIALPRTGEPGHAAAFCGNAPGLAPLYSLDRATIQLILKLRFEREKLLGADLVEDSAWTMLLDLLLTHLRGEELSVTSLYIGSGAPNTTALRRLNQLVEKGLAVKKPHPKDGRRMLVEITQKGADDVCTILSLMKRALSS